MKKVSILCLVFILVMSLSVTAFAENEGTEAERGAGREVERQEKVKGDILTVFETYYPEKLSEMSQLKSEHESFHENAKAEKETMKEEMKAEKQAFREEMKTAVENGEMTTDEVKAIMEAKKAEVTAIREDVQLIVAEKKSVVEGIKNNAKAVRETLREAIANEDIATIQSSLDQLMGYLEQHLDADYYYFDLIKAAKEQ